jgi:hypothetical protein
MKMRTYAVFFYIVLTSIFYGTTLYYVLSKDMFLSILFFMLSIGYSFGTVWCFIEYYIDRMKEEAKT